MTLAFTLCRWICWHGLYQFVFFRSSHISLSVASMCNMKHLLARVVLQVDVMDGDIPQVLAACADFGQPALISLAPSHQSLRWNGRSNPQVLRALPEIPPWSWRFRFDGAVFFPKATQGGWKNFANFEVLQECLRMLTVFSLNVQAETITFQRSYQLVFRPRARRSRSAGPQTSRRRCAKANRINRVETFFAYTTCRCWLLQVSLGGEFSPLMHFVFLLSSHSVWLQ